MVHAAMFVCLEEVHKLVFIAVLADIPYLKVSLPCVLDQLGNVSLIGILNVVESVNYLNYF